MTQASQLAFTVTGAQFSPDRVYRYALWRTWDEAQGHVMFVGLNPSTANETKDDPTIRREIRFAKAWGYGGIYKLNLHGWRSTDSAMLRRVPDSIGPENDTVLRRYAEATPRPLVVVVWGVHGSLGGRGKTVREMFTELGIELWCFGLTKIGEPRHTLYLPKMAMLQRLGG